MRDRQQSTRLFTATWLASALAVAIVVGLSLDVAAQEKNLAQVKKSDDKKAEKSSASSKPATASSSTDSKKDTGKANASRSEKISPKAAADGAKSPAKKLSPDREAAVIAFACEHHPELATLLANLKQNNQAEYLAALAELNRIVERLESLKKNASVHDYELALWKFDSRIRLLAARLTMSDNPAIEAELKATIREKLELTLAFRKAERDRLQKRLERLDQTIIEVSAKLDEATEKELTTVKRSLPSNKSAKNKPQKKGDEHAVNKPKDASSTQAGPDKGVK